MAKVLFVLGAGASRRAGAPLVSDFLDKAFELRQSSVLGEAEKRAFELVQEGLDALQIAHSKARLDITNLEEVFDAFEMAALVGRLGTLDSQRVTDLPDAMRTLITVTLERLVQLPAVDGRLYPCPLYASFAQLLSKLRHGTGSWPAVITFNYDVCVDYALHSVGVPFSYRLDERNQEDWVALLKLHGSLNWARCPDCGTVAARDMSAHFARRLLAPGSRTWRLAVAAETVQSVKCSKCSHMARELMIVPPTLAKAQYRAALRPVWAAAAAELGSAESIFVCGYSLSEADTFFRYLYAVGSIGDASLRRFWVFDPNPSLEPRFKAFLGQQAERRFKFIPMDFENMVRHVESELVR
jgi:hypothetical protein